MGSDFTFTVDIDVAIPDFMDASIPLQQIGEKVANEAQRNIRMQKTPDNIPFIELAKKTKRDKLREHAPYPKMALYRKGIMYNAIHAYKVTNNEIMVGVISRGSPRRDLIALIHQEQGVNQYTRITRPFLGISKTLQDWATKRMERWLSERVQKAAHKYINLKF